MKIARRDALLTSLFGVGTIGIRSLVTGLPVSFLMNPRKALADTPAVCGDASKAQFIILSTSGSGDPINANCPGTYPDGNAQPSQALDKITHPQDPLMQATALTINGKQWQAANPWSQLNPWLDRTCFFHMMTNTPVHPKEPQVLALSGATYQGEMFPSILSKALAPCLNTLQTQPMSVGIANPSETLTYGGAPQPNIPANALQSTLASAAGTPLTKLQGYRDTTLQSVHDLYYKNATPAQKLYLDSLINTQGQIRKLNQTYLTTLSSLTKNDPISQITAAITLFQMNITPVVSIHIPFGGDNHTDANLATEVTQTVGNTTLSGLYALAGAPNSLMNQLNTTVIAGGPAIDKVTFLSLNVFGRTLGAGTDQGRGHNNNHHVAIMIGKPFKGSVIGGATPVAGDYGALPIDSTSGTGSASGDVTALDTFPSWGKTVMQGFGIDAATINSQITTSTAKVIPGALK